MIAAIVVACVVGYLLIGTVVGAICDILLDGDEAAAVMGTILWPFAVLAGVVAAVSYGPYLLIRKAHDYLIQAIPSTTLGKKAGWDD